jgi:hypothetical protein
MVVIIPYSSPAAASDDGSFGHTQAGAVHVAWVVVPVKMDCRRVFGTDLAGGTRLASQSRMADGGWRWS